VPGEARLSNEQKIDERSLAKDNDAMKMTDMDDITNNERRLAGVCLNVVN